MREEYRKRKGRDTWHFWVTCRWWPKRHDCVVQKGPRRPRSGELCDECMAKERRDLKR